LLSVLHEVELGALLGRRLARVGDVLDGRALGAGALAPRRGARADAQPWYVAGRKAVP
jgi:hypothetical protein